MPRRSPRRRPPASPLVAATAEVVAADADLGHLQPRTTQSSMFHCLRPFPKCPYCATTSLPRSLCCLMIVSRSRVLETSNVGFGGLGLHIVRSKQGDPMAEAGPSTPVDLEVDRERRCVWRAGETIDLPRLSFEFLIALIDAAPAVVTHDELVARVWRNHFVSPETIAQRARMLRVSLGDSASEPRYFTAVRGIGYRWLLPARPMTPHANGSTATAPQSRLRSSIWPGARGDRCGALVVVRA